MTHGLICKTAYAITVGYAKANRCPKRLFSDVKPPKLPDKKPCTDTLLETSTDMGLDIEDTIQPILSEHETNVDYMNDNDDHTFGIWDINKTSLDVNNQDTFTVHIESPIKPTHTESPISALLKRGANSNDPSLMPEFSKTSSKIEDLPKETDYEKERDSTCYTEETLHDAKNAEANVPTDFQSADNLSESADTYWNNSEFDIDDEEERAFVPKLKTTMWLEESIMGTARRETNAARVNQIESKKNESVSRPWNPQGFTRPKASQYYGLGAALDLHMNEVPRTSGRGKPHK